MLFAVHTDNRNPISEDAEIRVMSYSCRELHLPKPLNSHHPLSCSSQVAVPPRGHKLSYCTDVYLLPRQHFWLQVVRGSNSTEMTWSFLPKTSIGVRWCFCLLSFSWVDFPFLLLYSDFSKGDSAAVPSSTSLLMADSWRLEHCYQPQEQSVPGG